MPMASWRRHSVGAGQTPPSGLLGPPGAPGPAPGLRRAGAAPQSGSVRSGSSPSPGPGVASYQAGPADGDPVLLHGFPYDP
jgi:hypothetical protein